MLGLEASRNGEGAARRVVERLSQAMRLVENPSVSASHCPPVPGRNLARDSLEGSLANPNWRAFSRV